MLPAPELAEIVSNLAALNLQPNTAAQILAAVLAPLLRNPRPELRESVDHKRPYRRAGRPRSRGAPRRRRYKRRAPRPADARERAGAALKANPDASLSAIAKIAGVSRPTVTAVRDELAAATRKRANPPADRRERAKRFLSEQLGRGPKPVSDVEAAASKAHVGPDALEQARDDLHVVTSRANTGGVHAVQWSLPG